MGKIPFFPPAGCKDFLKNIFTIFDVDRGQDRHFRLPFLCFVNAPTGTRNCHLAPGRSVSDRGSLHSIFGALQFSAALLFILHSLGIPASLYIDDTIITGRSRTLHLDTFVCTLFYSLIAQPTADDKSENSVTQRMLIALGLAYRLSADSFTLGPRADAILKLKRLGEGLIDINIPIEMVAIRYPL